MTSFCMQEVATPHFPIILLEWCVKCESDESIKLEIKNFHIKIKKTELTGRDVTFLHITTWRYKFIQDVKLLHDVKLMHAVFIGFTKV